MDTASQTRTATNERVNIASPSPMLRITPPSRWWVVPVSELWQARELVYFFVWRDIKVRYKQTAIGAAWAVLQPLLAMLVFTLFFGKLAHIPSEGLPYPSICLRRIVALDVFRGVSAERNKHDRRQSANHHESLFPASGVAAVGRTFRALLTSPFRF